MSAPRANYLSIVALGENFDVASYVPTCPLRIDEVWRRGDKWPHFDGFRPNSGLSIELGRSSEHSADEQQEIIASFLEEHESALKHLGALPGVESFYVGLELTVDRRSAGSIMDMPPSLMEIASKIGVKVTIWATLEPEGNTG